MVEKFDPEKVYTAVYFEGEQQYYYVKRFQLEPTDRLTPIIGEHEASRLEICSNDAYPRLQVIYGGRKKGVEEEIDLEEFIAVKGVKARGKRLTTTPVEGLMSLEPVKFPEVKEEEEPPELDETDSNMETDGEHVESVEPIESTLIDEDAEQPSLF
jgi:topoisomerase-4 subunit A